MTHVSMLTTMAQTGQGWLSLSLTSKGWVELQCYWASKRWVKEAEKNEKRISLLEHIMIQLTPEIR